MVQSTRITKFDYLYGRFSGAFLAAALCFLVISIGVVAGTLAALGRPGNDRRVPALATTSMPTLLGLPGVFLTSALFFALATVTRSMMATYVGVVAVFIVYLSATGVLGTRPEFETAMAWGEPFGLSALRPGHQILDGVGAEHAERAAGGRLPVEPAAVAGGRFRHSGRGLRAVSTLGPGRQGGQDRQAAQARRSRSAPGTARTGRCPRRPRASPPAGRDWPRGPHSRCLWCSRARPMLS